MKKGFTLVELLVVLVVIGILVALILPNTLAAIRQANNKECASNLRSIDTAIQMCYSEKRDWDACDTLAELTAGNFLDQDPVCSFGVAYAIEDAATGKRAAKTAHFDPWPPRTNNHK